MLRRSLMDADESIAEVKFPEPLPIKEFIERVTESGIAKYVGGNVNDVEWLTCAMLNIGKSQNYYWQAT